MRFDVVFLIYQTDAHEMSIVHTSHITEKVYDEKKLKFLLTTECLKRSYFLSMQIFEGLFSRISWNMG